jgi:hypothetical protein
MLDDRLIFGYSFRETLSRATRTVLQPLPVALAN